MSPELATRSSRRLPESQQIARLACLYNEKVVLSALRVRPLVLQRPLVRLKRAVRGGSGLRGSPGAP